LHDPSEFEQRIGYSEQASSFREQQRIIEDELRGLRELQAKGFASLNRVRALERAQEELRGREAAMTAEVARAGEGMGEVKLMTEAKTATVYIDGGYAGAVKDRRSMWLRPGTYELRVRDGG
jgi:hypothetical protein